MNAEPMKMMRNFEKKYLKLTSQFFHGTSFTAVFLWQHFLWDKLVQRFQVAVEVDTLTNLFLQEWTNKVDDGVNER